MCSFCQDKVYKRKEQVSFRWADHQVPHFYIFKWDEKSDLFCRSLAYFLKQKPTRFFNEWARLFSVKMKNNYSLALVPQSSSPKSLNHAVSLGQVFLKLDYISSVYEVDVRGGSEVPQKQKDKENRLKSEKRDFGALKYRKNWIFVDDVFVTGGTFKAVSESMFTKPRAVFTLFYKPKLKNKGFYDA